MYKRECASGALPLLELLLTHSGVLEKNAFSPPNGIWWLACLARYLRSHATSRFCFTLQFETRLREQVHGLRVTARGDSEGRVGPLRHILTPPSRSHHNVSGMNKYAILAFGVVAVAFAATFIRLASDAPPLTIAASRLAIATIILAPLALIRSG